MQNRLKTGLLSAGFLLVAGMAFTGVAPGLRASTDTVNHGLVPLPDKVSYQNGVFLLDENIRIDAPIDLANESAFLLDALKRFGGVTASRHCNEACRPVTLKTDPALAAVGADAYRLHVEADSITVAGAAGNGVFYGIQTLLQLLPADFFDPNIHKPAWTLPAVEISDHARFEWRGFMLDVSRHFFDRDVIKRLLERMARHKLNILHLHLTDDPGWRIEIEAYPNLTRAGAQGDQSDPNSGIARFFTQQDIKDIVAFARQHHITVVPEIDMPGHSGAAARAYPEFFDGHVTVNPANPETYGFINTVLDEVMDLFPAPYFHFGGDEVRNVKWGDLPEMQTYMAEHNLRDFKAVEGRFYHWIVNNLKQRGKTVVAWDEVIAHDVDKDTIVIWWHGRRPEILDHALEKGYRTVLAPSDHLYFDYPQAPGEPGAPWEGNENGPNSIELIYNWDLFPPAATEAQRAHIIGIQAALWTEFIKTERYLEFMTFPRLAAVAEKAWTSAARINYAGFLERLDIQNKRYKALGINYRIPGQWESPNAAQYIRH